MDCLTLARGVKEYCEAESLDCGEMMELQCYHRSHCGISEKKRVFGKVFGKAFGKAFG